MNQLPCNSLYCVPGRLVQLIWFCDTIDQAQKAANDGVHRPCVNMLIISLVLIKGSELNILNKHPHKKDWICWMCLHREADMDFPCSLFFFFFFSLDGMLCFQGCGCQNVFDLRSAGTTTRHNL